MDSTTPGPAVLSDVSVEAHDKVWVVGESGVILGGKESPLPSGEAEKVLRRGHY